MRRLTRANIRILSKENPPKVASEDDEMVQISGDMYVSRNALIQVTTRLKANFFDRENPLSAFPSSVPSVPYHHLALSEDLSKYGSRDSKSHSRGYSSYSGGYGGADLLPPEPYSSYDGSHSSYGGSQEASNEGEKIGDVDFFETTHTGKDGKFRDDVELEATAGHTRRLPYCSLLNLDFLKCFVGIIFMFCNN